MTVAAEVAEAVGDGVLSTSMEGVDGIRVGLAVAVEVVGRSVGVVAVATLVGPAVPVGVDAAGAVAVVGESVSCELEESLVVQAASNNNPAASDMTTNPTNGRIIDSLLAMAGLPFCRHWLHAMGLPRSWVWANTPWNYTLAVSG